MRFIDIYGMGGILKLTVDSKSEKKHLYDVYTFEVEIYWISRWYQTLSNDNTARQCSSIESTFAVPVYSKTIDAIVIHSMLDNHHV